MGEVKCKLLERQESLPEYYFSILCDTDWKCDEKGKAFLSRKHFYINDKIKFGENLNDYKFILLKGNPPGNAVEQFQWILNPQNKIAGKLDENLFLNLLEYLDANKEIDIILDHFFLSSFYKFAKLPLPFRPLIAKRTLWNDIAKQFEENPSEINNPYPQAVEKK